MRYRQLDKNGDYTFGGQQANFLLDSPEAVAQSVKTRLQLHRGEWFLDTSDGIPWETEVLGERTEVLRDMAIKSRILSSAGVVQIDSYESTFDPANRTLKVSVVITTVYGQANLSETF